MGDKTRACRAGPTRWRSAAQALLEALRDGHLGGVGLDVFWEEPADPADELFSFPNVIALPHTGAPTAARPTALLLLCMCSRNCCAGRQCPAGGQPPLGQAAAASGAVQHNALTMCSAAGAGVSTHDVVQTYVDLLSDNISRCREGRTLQHRLP